MRHGKKFNKLSRKAGHRKALLSNLSCALIEHKRISTTLAKAKELRKVVEPIITRSKTDTTHNRREAFSALNNKEAVKELFREVAPKVADRPGGYVRIIKTGFRQGDNAEMALVELVDFNELYKNEKAGKAGEAKKTRRRSTKKTETVATETETTEVVEEVEATEENNDEKQD
jgi:large subunit ribosomal protein L17